MATVQYQKEKEPAVQFYEINKICRRWSSLFYYFFTPLKCLFLVYKFLSITHLHMNLKTPKKRRWWWNKNMDLRMVGEWTLKCRAHEKHTLIKDVFHRRTGRFGWKDGTSKFCWGRKMRQSSWFLKGKGQGTKDAKIRIFQKYRDEKTLFFVLFLFQIPIFQLIMINIAHRDKNTSW